MMTLENAAQTIEAMFGWSGDSARAFAKSLFGTGITEKAPPVGYGDRYILRSAEHG